MVSRCLENNRTDPLTYRCRPVVIHVTVCEQWNSTPKTPYNLVWPCLSCPHSDEGRKELILSLLFLVVVQERCLHTHSWWHIWTLVCTHQKHEKSQIVVKIDVSRSSPWIFLWTLVSENMWHQHILIELLVVLLLLQPHIHFSSCSSRVFLTNRKEEGVQIGSWCSHHFTTQNTNTWLRTGVRQHNFGRGILKAWSQKNLVKKQT